MEVGLANSNIGKNIIGSTLNQVGAESAKEGTSFFNISKEHTTVQTIVLCHLTLTIMFRYAIVCIQI